MRAQETKGDILRAVLVDDEYYALENLRLKLSDIEGLEVVAQYEDAPTFLIELENTRPDLVFLDVEMPQLDGFEVLEQILESKQSPHIIFVTAYSQYAAKAFDIEALDYIVKPVAQDRLLRALAKIPKVSSPPKPAESFAPDAKLDIRCFRTFSIKLGNEEFNTGWRTKKAEELLAYLIAEKGAYVSKERIATDLWPEADYDKSLANLHVAYHYLKMQEKNKGIKLPIESLRGKMRFHIEEANCDFINFDQLRAKAMDTGLSDRERLALLEEASELYTGSLFQDRYYEWVLPLQQKYEILFDSLVKTL